MACECGSNPPIKEQLNSLSAVFAGTLATSSKINIANRQMVFEVSEIWKGPTQRYITVESSTAGGSCGWSAQKGVEYVIYANAKQDGKFTTSSCSGNEVLAQSTIRSELGNGTIPSASTVPSRTEVENVVRTVEAASNASSSLKPSAEAANTKTEPAVQKVPTSVSKKNETTMPPATAATETQKGEPFISWLFSEIRSLFSRWF